MTDKSVCVTVTPTVMDGTVVRWFASEREMRFGTCILSASRNKVVVEHAEFRSLDDFERFHRLATEAIQVADSLRRGDSVAHLATHQRAGLSGPYVAIDGGSPSSPADWTQDCCHWCGADIGEDGEYQVGAIVAYERNGEPHLAWREPCANQENDHHWHVFHGMAFGWRTWREINSCGGVRLLGVHPAPNASSSAPTEAPR